MMYLDRTREVLAAVWPPWDWALDVLGLTIMLVVLFAVVVVKWCRRSWQSIGILAAGWGLLLIIWAETAKNVPALAGWLGDGGLTVIKIIGGLEVNCVLWGFILIVRRAARRQRHTE